MATFAYSLPEAAERVEELQDIVAVSNHEQLSEDQLLDIAATLIRRADDLLAYLPAGIAVQPREATTLRVLTHALRKTTFLLMQEIDPEQAGYWTPGNQARIRETDQLLTPELRAEVLAEVADNAAVEQDGIALAERQAEDSAWETTVGDGLDAD